MRKFLLFMIALLAGVSGAWATDFDPNNVAGKTFTMQCSRGYVYYDGSTLKGTNNSANASHFAIVTYNSETYLYDATNSAFVCHSALKWSSASGNLALENNSDLSKAVKNLSFGNTEITAYPYYLAETEFNTWLNMDGSPTVYFNTWKNFEGGNGGNTYKIEIVDNAFDDTDALAVLGTWCMGDKLGGTMEDGDWKNTWTSGTTPSFTLTASANNINNTSGRRTGGLDIRSGGTQSSTYTFTAPAGYLITNYTISGYALNGNQTVTPAGGEATTFTSSGNVLTVSDLGTTKATFTLAGANNGLFIRAMQVTLSPISSITSLPTANNKAYVVTTARGAWNFVDNATSMTATTVTDLNSTNQQIALIYKNSNYYLFSVSEGKYLTGSNTLTSRPTDAEQVDIVATENATYPWFFRFKNLKNGDDKYTNNINVSAGTVKIDGWGPGGSNASGCLDEGNRCAVIEVDDFDATTALSMFDTRVVTYNLSYGSNATFRTVNNVTVTIGGDPAEFVPSSFIVPTGVQYTYSPATIAAETTEVTVTAQWIGPFNIAAEYNAETQNIWYVLDMHSSLDNYTWQYDATSGEVQTPVIAKTAYANLTDNNLFCFVGNPWDGFKIYNRQAGSTMTLRKAETGETKSLMSTTDDHNQFKLWTSNSISGAYCFKLDDDTYYLNKQKKTGDDIAKLYGWTARDQGSSVRFIQPGQYHLAAMATWNLDAPINAVGTKSYINTESLRENMLDARTNITADPFCVVGQFTVMNTIMNPVNESPDIALTDGYYRFVNAFTSWQDKAPTVYYNSANGRMEWSKASNASDNVNSIVKIDATTPSIYSPNAQKYMSVVNSTVSGALAAEAGTTVFTSLGSAQYNIVVGGGTMHTNGHNNGAGTSGNLTDWGGGSKNTADAWYIVKVEDLDISLNAGPEGDANYYATLCLPFDVTLDAACAYTLTLNGAKNGLTLSDPIDKIPAGTPVVLRHTTNKVTATINTGDAFNSGSPLSCDLTGVYVDTSVAGATDYFLGAAGDPKTIGFYHWAGSTLKANRAYFDADKLSGGLVKGFALSWDDLVDGIQTIDNGQLTIDNDKVIYNLAGQRINKLQRGVNIVNGKKVIIK